MSIERTETFRMKAFSGHQDLLKAQDRLMKTFEKTEDTVQFRKDFYELRWNYLEKCLTAYTIDLAGTELALKPHRLQLLQTKLAFYVTRFAEDVKRLFPKQKMRNGYLVFRFARAGNKLVAELSTAHDPFIGL